VLCGDVGEQYNADVREQYNCVETSESNIRILHPVNCKQKFTGKMMGET